MQSTSVMGHTISNDKRGKQQLNQSGTETPRDGSGIDRKSTMDEDTFTYTPKPVTSEQRHVSVTGIIDLKSGTDYPFAHNSNSHNNNNNNHYNHYNNRNISGDSSRIDYTHEIGFDLPNPWKKIENKKQLEKHISRIMQNGSDDKNNNYQQLIHWTKCGYQAIRRRKQLFLSLFGLMIPSQMPELLFINDIVYMKNMLHLNEIPLNAEDEKIKKLIIKELDNSVNDEVRIIDNVIHAYVHS